LLFEMQSKLLAIFCHFIGVLGQKKLQGKSLWALPYWCLDIVRPMTQHQLAHRKATVLIGQMKIIIFEEAVHQDDEFAHAGGHDDEGFLALRPASADKTLLRCGHAARCSRWPIYDLDRADSKLGASWG
jgi:hypothetical protein